jgi:hypothetical protein
MSPLVIIVGLALVVLLLIRRFRPGWLHRCGLIGSTVVEREFVDVIDGSNDAEMIRHLGKRWKISSEER